jgi:hypothetical protein
MAPDEPEKPSPDPEPAPPSPFAPIRKIMTLAGLGAAVGVLQELFRRLRTRQ